MPERLAARLREIFGKRQFVLAVLLVFGFTLGAEFLKSRITTGANPPEPPYEIKSYIINAGDSFDTVMAKNGLEKELASLIFSAAKPIYDLSKIVEGHTLEFIFEKEKGELVGLNYGISPEKELRLKKENDSHWITQIIEIPYEIKLKVATGVIETSMYEAGLRAGLDERTIMNLAEAFQWTIDFALDPRRGDTFKVLYEERYRDGKYVMPGKILAAIYKNNDTTYEIYYFKEVNGNEGYFDQNGNSVQKIFLRSPVEYKYISSGFTTGKRYVQEFDISTGHRAIDYAAPYGTPIRAVGDGIVTFAGWDAGAYGYFTAIRHNDTYSTHYAHQSRIIVKKGERVKQGQIIGYVGSTGLSTGPHLHFEMLKNGVKINPLKEKFPAGKPIAEESKAAFESTIATARNILLQP
jgi:murein DD-endopeptidase MepM/ murein hydrolase activator NlpD